jgi:hypothetical protein
MPLFDVSTAIPRQELSLAIMEGEGSLGGCISDEVLPDFPINRRTAHLIKATIQDTQALRQISAPKYIRAPGTLFERIVAKLGDDTFTVTLRGVEIVIPNEPQLDYAGYADLEAFYAARFGNEFSRLTKELLAAAQIFNTTNFGSATNSSVAYTAALLSTNSLIPDLIASSRRVKAKGEPPPFVAVMSGVVFERVRQATTVQGYVTGTLRAGQEATHNMIEQSVQEFGIKSILIGDAYYNSAADGATPALTQVWNNTYIWVGRPGLAKSVGMDAEPSSEKSVVEGLGVPILGGCGVMAYWESFDSGGIPGDEGSSKSFDGGNYVESYYAREIDSQVLRIKMSSTPYIGNVKCGDLIATQYS